MTTPYPAAIGQRSRSPFQWTVWTVIVAALSATTALAQPATHKATGIPENMMADQLVLMARQSLIGNESPTEDQLVQARVLLDFALRLAPDLTESWRLRVELARLLGDRAGEMVALEQYCRLRPEDDAAQLALIVGNIGSYQTLDQRVSAAERIIDGDGSEQLSSALRSRMSSYAARGALEAGDKPRFLRRLKAAMRLDPSNKEAAQLTLDWLISNDSPPAKIGAALLRLVWADPTDPQPRRWLGDLLLSQGAYEEAAQQYQEVRWLTNNPVDEQMTFRWVLSTAASGDSQTALDRLADFENHRAQLAMAQATEDQPSTPPAMLPMDLELLRAVILTKLGQTTRAVGSFERLERMLLDQAEKGDPQANTDLTWLTLLLGRSSDRAQTLEQITADRPVDDPFVIRLTGWRQLRDADPDSAWRTLAPSAQDDPYAAYGVALTYKIADDPVRLAQLHQVIHMAPDNLVGLMAVLDLREVGSSSVPTDQGRLLTRLLEGWPGSRVHLNPAQEPWVAVDIQVEPSQFAYLEPITAKLTLRNMTRQRLSLGGGGVLPTRLLLYASMRRAGISMGDLPPIVVDMSRSLALEPRGHVAVEVRVDQSDLGVILSTSPSEAIGFDIKAILQPQAGHSAPLAQQLMSSSHTAYLLERRAWVPTEREIHSLITMLQDPAPVNQMRALALLVQTAVNAGNAEENQELIQSVTDAVNNRFGQLTPLSQAWGVRFLPAGESGEQLFDTVHQTAQRSDDPMVMVIYALTHVSNPLSAVINSMLRHPDPTVVSFAQTLRNVLLANEQLDESEDETSLPSNP